MFAKIVLLLGFCLTTAVAALPDPDTLLPTDYGAARLAVKSNFQHKGPSPQQADPLPEKLPAGVRQVTFKSGDLELKAWLSDKNDGQKHPAVVYCHGGFAFSKEDFTDEAAKFVEAGFVVFCPMLRGENGNPGSFELFLGEVDDVVAAGRFVAALASVDRERVFVSGHSAGATVALMAVMKDDSPYAAAAPIGAAMDMLDILRPEFGGLFVFDPLDPREMLVRSPIYFASSLKKPTFLVVGDQDPSSRFQGHQFTVAAKAAGASCEVLTVPGDHNSCKPAAISAIVSLLKTWKPAVK
jgi:dipeptidyl aminopeptidase/acylaminoacyl peptidase